MYLKHVSETSELSETLVFKIYNSYGTLQNLRLGNLLLQLETSMKLDIGNLKLYIQVLEHETLGMKHEYRIYLRVMTILNASVGCYSMMFGSI